MGIEDHEIPAGQRAAQAKAVGGDELASEDITEVNRPVYLLVIGGLVAALLLGVVAWFVLAMSDKAMPEGLAVLMGSIGGALVGLLTGARKK
jgi:hypothetical protein